MTSKLLSDEIERLKGLGLVEKASEQSDGLYNLHVKKLSERLKPAVAKALHAESEAAAERWLENAEHVIAWVQGMLEVDSDDPVFTLGASSEFSPDAATEPMRPTSAEKQRVLEMLTSSSGFGRVPISDGEIEQHATGLSQLLFSNWLSLLNQALVDAEDDHSIRLEYKALPPQADPGRLANGCEAYALPVDDAVGALMSYQDSLAEPGNTIELPARVSLHRTEAKKWLAFRSVDGSAQRMPERRFYENPLEAAYQDIAYDMADHLVPEVARMGLPSTMDAEKVKQLVMTAACSVLIGQRRHQRNVDMRLRKHGARTSYARAYACWENPSSRGEKLAKGVDSIVRARIFGFVGEASTKEMATFDSVGALHAADLYFVSLPTIKLVQWMERHKTVPQHDCFRPDKSTEKWVVKNAVRIAQGIHGQAHAPFREVRPLGELGADLETVDKDPRFHGMS